MMNTRGNLSILLSILFLMGMVTSCSIFREHGRRKVLRDVSDYVIVLPAKADTSEVTVAGELSSYIFQITGKSISVIREDQYSKDKNMLAVGFNDKLPPSLKKLVFGSLRAEEIIIAQQSDVLLLAGGEPRGTRYAVYEFLHRLGVRWYTPNYTKIPKLEDISIEKMIYRYAPPFRFRAQLVGNNPTMNWKSQNRLNSDRLWRPLPKDLGGGFSQGPDMHTFSKMISLPKLRENGDWMAMIDGQRENPVGNEWALCLSNREVRSYLVKQTMDWVRDNQDVDAVWLSQNDGSKYCTCDQCMKLYGHYGGKPSSANVVLINELADVLESEFPTKLAKTLAYTWSLDPPTNIKVSDEAMIMLCADGNFSIPIKNDVSQARLRDAITDWSKIAKNLEVYLYAAPFESYWFVEPSTYSAGENIQWAAEQGANGVYTQVSGYGNTYGSHSFHLRAWLYARLCWNPREDMDTLINDFVRGYYGPAADVVLQSIAWSHHDILDPKGMLKKSNGSDIVPNHVDPGMIRKVNILFEEKYESLNDSLYQARLSLEWLPYLWTDFWLGFKDRGLYDDKSKTWRVSLLDADERVRYGKLAKKFMLQHSISAVREKHNINPNDFAVEMYDIPWDAYRLTEESTQVIVVPKVGGKITGFASKATGFEPLKEYWGYTMLNYPLSGTWRDRINDREVNSYSESNAPEDARSRGVYMASETKDVRISKHVVLDKDTLNIRLQATRIREGQLKIQSSFMLNLQENVFGIHPTIYVEQIDGTWKSNQLGVNSIFWYQSGRIDISGSTGRVVVGATHRLEGILLKFNPSSITALDYEYDVFDGYPADQSKMVWISPTLVDGTGRPGDAANLHFSITILDSVKQLLKRL